MLLWVAISSLLVSSVPEHLAMAAESPPPPVVSLSPAWAVNPDGRSPARSTNRSNDDAVGDDAVDPTVVEVLVVEVLVVEVLVVEVLVVVMAVASGLDDAGIAPVDEPVGVVPPLDPLHPLRTSAAAAAVATSGPRTGLRRTMSVFTGAP